MKRYLLIGLIIGIFLLSGCRTGPFVCSDEAKICPDGSAVARNPMNDCEFDPCPEVEEFDVNSCEDLSEELDKYLKDGRIRVDFQTCEKDSILVGGILINIENSGFDPSRNDYNWELTFESMNKQGTMYLTTYTDQGLPYVTDQFYKFDLKEICAHLMSSALSGSFVDRELDKLKPLDCQ